MKRNNLIFIALLLPLLLATSCNLLKQSSKGARVAPVEYSKDAAVNYLLTYKDAAVAEMERTGIPASVTLAQAFLESAYGTSELARSANNHFGIKCGGTAWKGDTYKKEDDDYDKNGKKIESCFRKYDMVEESFYDHSEFLRDPRKYNRYGFLFNLDRTDYKSWSRGLQSSGYATAGDYADKLINLIERYQLYRYDKGGAAGVPDLPTPPNGNPLPGTEPPTVPSTGTLPAARRVGRINDSKVVLARSGETIETIARMYRLDPADVADYNDRGYTPGMKLRENTRIFIQAKRSKWRGRDREYMVREGQSIFEISQLHGLKVEALRDRNGLRDGEEPATGERITLKGRSTRRVRLRTTPLPTDSGQPVDTTRCPARKARKYDARRRGLVRNRPDQTQQRRHNPARHNPAGNNAPPQHRRQQTFNHGHALPERSLAEPADRPTTGNDQPANRAAAATAHTTRSGARRATFGGKRRHVVQPFQKI
jgi:LysM repeat protein